MIIGHHDTVSITEITLTTQWTITYWFYHNAASSYEMTIGKNGEIIAQGYNGFPRGIEDTDERYDIREEKYKYVVHIPISRSSPCAGGIIKNNFPDIGFAIKIRHLNCARRYASELSLSNTT